MPRRFFSAKRLTQGQCLPLPPELARHMVTVLRLSAGEEIILFDGTGGEYPARLAMAPTPAFSEKSRKPRISPALVAQLGEWRPVERESPLFLTLAQTMQAQDKMDFTLQKAVELGVSAFVPLSGRRSTPRLSGERAEKRQWRWRGVAVSACEQCGRNRVPEIYDLRNITDWLREDAVALPGLKFILLPGAPGNLSEFSPSVVPEHVTLLVGAEGGFAPEEEDAALRAGFMPLALGERVLRTETAGLAALAILQHLWGDL
ncbi:MAG: 16S rRNA (uracil(1498)-N(3))-methyltransferase [Zoogloeaceae bacterium]|jgi:16S rRNA (uracil1498-N3)-methyltransferase|nr:16S rRNA (uracil(1498)-N(3))-methyltransferase [Zoogloeaceae bacterium]